MSSTTKNDDTFQIKLLPPVYGVEFFIALFGNVFALCLLIIKEKRNWHTGVVFVFNLAVCDILYILTLPLLIDYYLKEKDWNFGSVACKIERFLFTCNLHGSIFFIMAISVNRWVAIVYPFFTRNHVTPKHAKIASVLIWAVVIAVSSPVLHMADTCPKKDATKGDDYCMSVCDHAQKQSHFKYKISLAVIGCLIPLLVTFSSYISIIRVIYKNANITVLEKRKVGLMVGSVLVLYIISFVPYHILQLTFIYIKMLNEKRPVIYNAYQISKGLVTLNMCLHPILYMAVFDSIRVACCGKISDGP